MKKKIPLIISSFILAICSLITYVITGNIINIFMMATWMVVGTIIIIKADIEM